jgi:hypothetical protein
VFTAVKVSVPAPVVAQKFTVDPRLMAAVQGSTANDDAESYHDTDSEDEKASPVTETRAERLDRLTREYEEEVQKSKEAAEKGEGCLLCSS